MIRISCTNCKTILSIDDAFAGGVCRCQHCGTIQTVPAKARDGAAVGASGQSIGGMKAHFQNGDAPSGTGLDELAGVVVSSGLSSSRLTRSGRRSSAKAAKPNLMPIVVAAGVIVIVLVFVIIYLATRSNNTAGVTPGRIANDTGITNPAQAITNSPNFCGIPITGNTIIYLLDRGGNTVDYFGDLKDATLKSIGTLGSNRKFQIIFWSNGTDSAYPENTTAYAAPQSISEAQKAMDDVAPFGQTDIKSALTLAMAQHPDLIVIATGKGWDFNSEWLDGVMAIRGAATVKIDAFNLDRSAGESAPMKKLAAATGGTYRDLTKTDLRSFAQ